MGKIIALAMVLVLMVGNIFAQEEEKPKTITVSANAEIRVTPDIVVITLGIETQDKELAKAKADNDEKAQAVLALAKELEIDQKCFSTDYIHIEPVYKERSSYELKLPALVGYRVEKSVEVILKEGNVAKFEKLISRAVESGANEISGVEFKTTKLREHRDNARKLAIKAAKEKAELLAGGLGQKVGKAMNIVEGYGRWYSPYNQRGYRGGYNAQNVSQNARESSSGTEDSETASTFSIGQISVDASVTVTFELVDD